MRIRYRLSRGRRGHSGYSDRARVTHSSWITSNPEIEVQPCPAASTGFHSGVRRASSAVTCYVSFKEGTAKVDTQFAVFGHKTASDTKSSLCAQTHKRPTLAMRFSSKCCRGLVGDSRSSCRERLQYSLVTVAVAMCILLLCVGFLSPPNRGRRNRLAARPTRAVKGADRRSSKRSGDPLQRGEVLAQLFSCGSNRAPIAMPVEPLLVRHPRGVFGISLPSGSKLKIDSHRDCGLHELRNRA